MALVTAMFKVFPAKYVHRQKVKVKPVEHHYEEPGEEPYIKYGCPICEQIAKNVEGLRFEDDNGEGVKFKSFSFPKGTETCPCCNVNIDWDYKYKTGE